MLVSRPHGRSDVILIAGPTASGKSRLALELARQRRRHHRQRRLDAGLRRAAHPDGAADRRGRGRGAAPPLRPRCRRATRYSVGRWLDDVARCLAEAREAGRLPIVVGGTGLYFKALTEGLAAIPPIPAEVRERILARERRATAREALHARLAAIDPEDAARIRPSDRARIVRALEVFEATGRSLAAWQRAAPATPLRRSGGGRAHRARRPTARVLHERIAGARRARWSHDGALDEVEGARARSASIADLPAMKAIGVRELVDHIAGKHVARRGDRRHQDRDPPLRQAPDDLVPQPDGGLAGWVERRRPRLTLPALDAALNQAAP